MFDVTSFINRKHWTIEDLANQLFESGGRSRVGMWKSGGSSPRYAAILKLIDLGVTAEELFGKEYAEKLWKNSAGVNQETAPDIFDTPEFQEGVAKALKDLKARGLIK